MQYIVSLALDLDHQAACLPPGEASAGKQGAAGRPAVDGLLLAVAAWLCLLALYRHEHGAAITKNPMGDTDSLLIIITVSRPLQNRRACNAPRERERGGKKHIFKHSCSLYDAPCVPAVSITKDGRAHLAGV